MKKLKERLTEWIILFVIGALLLIDIGAFIYLMSTAPSDLASAVPYLAGVLVIWGLPTMMIAALIIWLIDECMSHKNNVQENHPASKN